MLNSPDKDKEFRNDKAGVAYEVNTSDVPGGEGVQPDHELKRQLKSRHIAMISIGGVIGTGLFLGTATSLRNGGPLGLFLGYTIMGSICYSVAIALGEMVSYLPIAGGHITLADRFVDESLSFTMGWNYWYNWVVVLPAELSAAAVLVSFWVSPEDISPAVWISICIVVVVVINFLGTAAYGEAEFWFASIKVITIVGLIILSIVITAGGGPDHTSIGFRFWRNPGAFVQFQGIPGAKGRFLGFWAVLSQAAFSFIGTEIVAIAAGEAKNPRRNIPRAIKRVYIRILLFYLLGTFLIGMIVASNDPALTTGTGTAASSPFVVAIRRAGIRGLPSVINAALISSAWSAASSDMYTSSRALYGLALSGQAPKIFKKVTKGGLPYPALLVSLAFTFLSYMGTKSGSSRVFGWFANMTSMAGLLTWLGILITYMRFHAGMKAQGFDRDTLPFKAPLQPFLSYYAAFMIFIIAFFNQWAVLRPGNWDAANFVTGYLPLVLFPVLYFGHKLAYRTRPKTVEEMDFVTGIREIEAACYDDPPPTTIVGKIWNWLM